MERDLKKLRAKRAEKERAASILTQPAGVVKNTSSAVGTKKSPSAMEMDTLGIKEEAEPAQPTNEIKAEEDIVVEEHKPDLQPNEPVTINGIETVGLQPAASATQPIDLDPSAGLAINLQPDLQASKAPTPKAEEPASKSSDQSQSALALNPAEAQPTATQDPDPAPFESMFTDLENPSGPTSLDFDLGFPPASTDAPDLLMDDTIFNSMPAAASNIDDQIQTQTLNTTAEDIDTLLPGLDNYVNDPADFSMLDLTIPTAASTAPETTTTATAAINNSAPPPAQPQIANIDAAGAQQGQMDSAPSALPLESSFDDLFGGSGDWGAVDDEMGGDGGTLGDFDEDWFRTDV